MVLMSAQPGPPERPAQGQAGTGPPALARYWWVTGLRGLVGLMLALAIVVAGHDTAHLVTFLALYWMTGGLLTLRFALAIRPHRGFGLGLVAGSVAVVGALLVVARNRLSWLVDPDVLIVLLGISASLTGLLRVLGGFATQERPGRQWTLGDIVLGTLELAFVVLSGEGLARWRLLRFQPLPIQPCVKVSLTRLTDTVHRVACADAYRTVPASR